MKVYIIKNLGFLKVFSTRKKALDYAKTEFLESLLNEVEDPELIGFDIKVDEELAPEEITVNYYPVYEDDIDIHEYPLDEVIYFISIIEKEVK